MEDPNNYQAPKAQFGDDCYRYIREDVLLWDEETPSHQLLPFSARFVTDEGVYPVPTWIARPTRTDLVDKVCAVILSLPDHRMYLVSAQRGDAIDPIEMMYPNFCPVPRVVVDVQELLQTITTPELRRFVTDVFTLTPVFLGYWTASAGSKHHSWTGGLASHSMAVACEVAKVMHSAASRKVNFSNAEHDLGVVAALLHDVGKTVSYTDEGYCNERALTIGHELLGLELIRKPLTALCAGREDLADAMTALLLSRTRFACSTYRLEAIRQVLSKADRDSAARGTNRWGSQQ